MLETSALQHLYVGLRHVKHACYVIQHQYVSAVYFNVVQYAGTTSAWCEAAQTQQCYGLCGVELHFWKVQQYTLLAVYVHMANTSAMYGNVLGAVAATGYAAAYTGMTVLQSLTWPCCESAPSMIQHELVSSACK